MDYYEVEGLHKVKGSIVGQKLQPTINELRVVEMV
jgi:hypothetical protein